MVRVPLWVPCWTNYQTYQGNPCGVYPDLSSLSGSGVIQTLWPVSSDPLLVRITSSGIKASTLDIGSILSNFYFFLCNLSQVHVLFCNLCSCLRVLRVCLRSCFVLVSLLLRSCSCFILFQNFVSNSVWGKFCLLDEFRF